MLGEYFNSQAYLLVCYSGGQPLELYTLTTREMCRDVSKSSSWYMFNSRDIKAENDCIIVTESTLYHYSQLVAQSSSSPLFTLTLA